MLRVYIINHFQTCTDTNNSKIVLHKNVKKEIDFIHMPNIVVFWFSLSNCFYLEFVETLYN